MILAVLAGAILWLAQSPVPSAALNATSPVLKDRNGALLNVRTVEAGTWRMPIDIDDLDPAFIEALLYIEDMYKPTRVATSTHGTLTVAPSGDF